MAQNEPYLRPMSATARAGNAALLIAGMIVLFFQISVLLLTGPNLWQHSTLSQTEAYLASSMVFFGIGGGLLSFWWKTRPGEGDGWLITYIGIGFVAFGLFVVAVAVSSSFALTIFVVLAGIVVAMGTVLMILGLQIPPPPKQPAAKNGDDEDWELEFL